MRTITTFFVALSLTLAAHAQKVNYNDLIVLYDKGDYKTAESFLKKYMREGKNNIHAHLFLGKIYEAKSTASNDPNLVVAYSDSAYAQYSIFKDGLRAKDLLSHGDYYKSYRRRDLITGQYVVKLSDIQQHIESKIKTLSTIRGALQVSLTQPVTTETEKPPPAPIENTTSLRSSAKYYALIIGISVYDSSSLNLDKPVHDAKELESVLTSEYEFEKGNVYSLLNPSRQQILMLLYGFRKKITSLDNLLIFYAGHGYWDKDANQGYWWPRDASQENPSNWLSNSDIREQIRSIKSAHTLLISDACFSGGIFKVRGANTIKDAPMDVVSLYKLPSRRAITSGTMTTVPDQSVFFTYLIKRLKSNSESYLSSQALFDSFRKAVINNSLIVPQDGVIFDTGDEGGDFIFIKKG